MGGASILRTAECKRLEFLDGIACVLKTLEMISWERSVILRRMIFEIVIIVPLCYLNVTNLN